ncbi:DNA polymerase I [Porphyridium purpureum]|uniref:DNA polymerase I n=1 Tax=Porphyridium purpureum TaxID=35688 RepID=A0A5J4YWM1_PORPP|nr:DNA polymerase I [Porphyridium purpureum]|eukprot:POR4079..scf227_4
MRLSRRWLVLGQRQSHAQRAFLTTKTTSTTTGSASHDEERESVVAAHAPSDDTPFKLRLLAVNADRPVYARPTGSFFVLDGLDLLHRNLREMAGRTKLNMEGCRNETYVTSWVLSELITLLKVDLVGNSPMAVVLDCQPSPGWKQRIPKYRETRCAVDDPALEMAPCAAWPWVWGLFNACGFPVFTTKGKGDDIITRLAVEAARAGQKTIIISGDKLFRQLLKQDSISTLKPLNKPVAPVVSSVPKRVRERMRYTACVHYDENRYRREYGNLAPSQLTDLLALMGDVIDEQEGTECIDARTAVELLLKYNSVEQIFNSIDELHPPEIQTLLLDADRERIYRTKKRAQLYPEPAVDDPSGFLTWGDAQLRKEPDLVDLKDVFTVNEMDRKRFNILCALLEKASHAQK